MVNLIAQRPVSTGAVTFFKPISSCKPRFLLFCGDVPEDLKQAALGMGLDATSAPFDFAFERDLASVWYSTYLS